MTSLSAGLMDSLVVLETDGTLINREDTREENAQWAFNSKGTHEVHPFGETSFGGFAKKRYRFNGKEKDEESGLYNYGQRYYAPWLCRFVSVDPIAESYPQLSSYNYAGNKPITSPDIDGLQGTEDGPMQKMESKSGLIQLADTNGVPTFEYPAVEITGTHPAVEGEMMAFPSVALNPMDGKATVLPNMSTIFVYHQGIYEGDEGSGWYPLEAYAQEIFNRGMLEGQQNPYSSGTSNPFYEDGRPLAEGYREVFDDVYTGGMGAGQSKRHSEMSGRIEMVNIEFEVISLFYTFGQLNLLRSGAKGLLTAGAAKAVTGAGDEVGAIVAASAAKEISVIGPRATYRQFARDIGAKFLNVTDDAWTWAKNEKFLEGVVKRGDDVVFAGKFNPAKLDPSSVLAKEIKYLTDRGYQWTDDFSKMIKK